MADLEAKAKEIIAGFHPYIGGPVWNEKAESLIIAALTNAVAAEREACARKIDVLAEMTTEPQATAYRFSAYCIRSRGSDHPERTP